MATNIKQVGDDFLVEDAAFAGTRLENAKINNEEMNTVAINSKAVFRKYTRVVSKEPTCTVQGNYRYTAKDGGNQSGIDYSNVKPYNWDEAIAALGHNFGSYVTDVSPTCTSAGTKSQHCSRCGTRTNIQSIGALGHDVYTTTYSYSTTGYCYNFVPCAWIPQSSTTYHCRRCGATW